MDSKQVFIRLGASDWESLRQLAQREHRDPKRQAARLISEGLLRDARARDRAHRIAVRGRVKFADDGASG